MTSACTRLRSVLGLVGLPGLLAAASLYGCHTGAPSPPPPPPPVVQPIAPAALPPPGALPASPAALPPAASPAAAGASPVAAAVGPSPRTPLVDASTHVVIAGLLRFSDPSLAGFRVEDRRDVELGRVLVASGVPAAQVTTLLDERATRAAVLEAVGRAADATPRGGTLLFYYAGHGIRTRQGDIAYVAYDTLGSDASRPGISVEDLFAVLAPRVVGKRVVLLGDCCHSGGLGDLAARLGTLGITALSLTSADASNLSTGNWTYSQLLLEGLRGDPALDANNDARVDLGELEAGVRAAMRHREHQRSGANLSAVQPAALTVAPRHGPPRAGAEAGQFMRDRHGQIVRVNRVDGAQATVRRYAYALSRDTMTPLSELTHLRSTRYPVGTELLVEWGGREWPAVVTAQEDDFAFITYPGWPHYWDEWILEDRVRRVVRLAP